MLSKVVFLAKKQLFYLISHHSLESLCTAAMFYFSLDRAVELRCWLFDQPIRIYFLPIWTIHGAVRLLLSYLRGRYVELPALNK